MRTRSKLIPLILVLAMCSFATFAQQTGSIAGTARTADGQVLPGVTVEARSSVLPQPRTTTTSTTGEFRFPQLPPAAYVVRFTLDGMGTQSRNVKVLLGQEARAEVTMGLEGLSEAMTVTAQATLVDTTSQEIRSALGEEILELPVGQEYRDLVKLIPAVQYTEDATRGPSAGASGQDNVYNFDGVNVTLPLFGTLSAEPASHDILQIAAVKGGAQARDFNRAGGFSIDSISKSGTSEFTGHLGYEIQTDSMTANEDTGATTFERDRDWITASLGGPILRDRLFFYGSYYRPEVDRQNAANAYGEIPDFNSTRDEYFGKLTFTPAANILLNGSYRDSDKQETGSMNLVTPSQATTSDGAESRQKIGILEGSWIINDRSYATLKYTDYGLETGGIPDVILGFEGTVDGSRSLNVNDLASQGLFVVPSPISGQTNFNAFIVPIIDRYGYLRDGVKTGGGRVGVASQFNDQDFYRESAQVGYDISLGSWLSHDLHFGYQTYTDEEVLRRSSNGWGLIEIIGGRSSFQGTPIMYQAEFQRSTVGGSDVEAIRSEFESQNIEFNDSIRWNDWTFNIGVVASQDTLFGQGLREDSSTLSGYVSAPGNKYEMYKVDFDKQIQPRAGVTWAYNGVDTVYTSFARYNPAANSLARAASWDRNTLGLTYRAYFDADGNLFGWEPRASTSGKLFVPDMEPRFIDEYILGTAQQLNSRWAGRLYARYRYSANFWEDTNNTARVAFQPPEGIPRDPYIPNLTQQLGQIGSGSSYVIAELDGSFTKYYEATLESEWRGDKTFFRGSYTWSHYYGNFDQDNTTTANDDNIFIGSSFIADAAGRQLWDNRYGNLRGDRRHILKLYGSYNLSWRASVGAFGVYQSGQPWEAWSYLPYTHLTTSTSSTSRFAEPAGSRTSPSHYQVDLNYTQNFPVRGLNFQVVLDAFNITDNQTGYNFDPFQTGSTFGNARSFYDPRRFQLSAKLQF